MSTSKQLLLALHNSTKHIVDCIENENWPCHECGRTNKKAPLRLITTTTEDGTSYKTGCFLCNNIEQVQITRKLLVRIKRHLRKEGIDV